MNRVMDGVRCVRVTSGPAAAQGLARPLVPARTAAKSPVAPAPRAAHYAGGMDGVGRPSRPVGPVVAATPLAPEYLAAEPVRRQQSWWPEIQWRRAGMATGLAAVALLVSLATVHALSTPRSSTARAETEAGPSGPPSSAPAKVSPATAKTGLQTLLNNFAAANPGKFSIVVKDLSSGETASVDPDDAMESASLYKLFVADQVYHLIDSGKLSYTSQAGSGSNNTVQGCLALMITISDNTCGLALGNMLNWGSQNPALAAQGYTETDLTTPQQTSARDVALMFEHLYDGTLNSAASNAAFLSLLKQQKVNDRLPMGLPAGTVIAHKTGNLDDVVHDAGIVYGPQTAYLVVVMSGNWSAAGNVPAMFTNLSQQLWTYFEQ